jgi:lactoylglutathione lyase
MSEASPVGPPRAERKQPESLRGRTLSVSLTVNDLERSLRWYRDVVGFTVDREYEREGKKMAVSLKAGVAPVLLTQDDGAKGSNRVKGDGFSFQITTTQNIDDIANRIKERGGSLESEPSDTRWGTRMFRLRDPDGFRVTITSDRDQG